MTLTSTMSTRRPTHPHKTRPRETRPVDKRPFSAVRKSEALLRKENAELKSRQAALVAQAAAATARASHADASAERATADRHHLFRWAETNGIDAVAATALAAQGLDAEGELPLPRPAEVDDDFAARAAALRARIEQRKHDIEARMDAVVAPSPISAM